jgi:phosphomevalonate kinase
MATAVIALSGKRFSGKDTLATLLCDRAVALGEPLRRRALADECKRAFVEEQAAAGVAVDLAGLLGDRAYKERWRPALTAFTERALARNPAVFCERLLPPGAPAGEPLLVTDVRLLHDASFLKAHGDTLLVRLSCDDAARARFGWTHTDGVDTHRTETELDRYAAWDLIIPNNGSLADLDAWAGRALSLFTQRAGRPVPPGNT